jgi:hypothetical protein
MCLSVHLLSMEYKQLHSVLHICACDALVHEAKATSGLTVREPVTFAQHRKIVGFAPGLCLHMRMRDMKVCKHAWYMYLELFTHMHNQQCMNA